MTRWAYMQAIVEQYGVNPDGWKAREVGQNPPLNKSWPTFLGIVGNQGWELVTLAPWERRDTFPTEPPLTLVAVFKRPAG